MRSNGIPLIRLSDILPRSGLRFGFSRTIGCMYSCELTDNLFPAVCFFSRYILLLLIPGESSLSFFVFFVQLLNQIWLFPRHLINRFEISSDKTELGFYSISDGSLTWILILCKMQILFPGNSPIRSRLLFPFAVSGKEQVNNLLLLFSSLIQQIHVFRRYFTSDGTQVASISSSS